MKETVYKSIFLSQKQQYLSIREAKIDTLKKRQKKTIP